MSEVVTGADGLEDVNVKIIAVEEHWNSVSIRDALDRLQGGARDESVAFNTMGDNQARLEDTGQGRVEAMDAAGIDVSILSVVTPATQALPAADAVALAREANDEATDAVRAHPDRFRAFATLPTSDPQAAAAELERCATQLGHVGAMVHGRTGSRTLDDPAYDDLFATAARLHQPVFIHPQIASNELRDAAYRGLDPLTDLGLATFGWGWHMDAGLAALRLILRGTFDRHPDLQLVLGHWGEMLLFWMDRADSLSGVAKHLERRVSDYITTNIYVTSSGMLQERLLRHALDFTSADRVLFSTDYPFHQPDAAAVEHFLDAVPDPSDRAKIAFGNAEGLFRLASPDAPGR
jgi:predicted TIM-barrel fold metal-dependent hydrolase